MNDPKLYDSAYPGSMFPRDEGDFVRADDNESLAAALLRNMRDVQLSRDGWKDAAIQMECQRDEALAELKKLNDLFNSGNWSVVGKPMDIGKAMRLPYEAAEKTAEDLEAFIKYMEGQS